MHLKDHKIIMYYFSGTGNTRYLFENIQSQIFETQHIQVDMHAITADNTSLSAESMEDSCLFLGYPIHGLGAPKIVEKWVQRLPIVEKAYVIIAMTAGDRSRINNGATIDIARILIEKGYQVLYERIFIMGANFLIGYSDCLNQMFYAVIPSKVTHMLNHIESKNYQKLAVNNVAGQLYRGIHFGESEIGSKVFGKSLFANNTCTNCDQCIKACPTHNITRKNNTLCFGLQCTFCMKCIYECPRKAIQSKWGQFLILKNGYNGKQIAKATFIHKERLFENGKLKNVYLVNQRRFRQYFLDESL